MEAAAEAPGPEAEDRYYQAAAVTPEAEAASFLASLDGHLEDDEPKGSAVTRLSFRAHRLHLLRATLVLLRMRSRLIGVMTFRGI